MAKTKKATAEAPVALNPNVAIPNGMTAEEYLAFLLSSKERLSQEKDHLQANMVAGKGNPKPLERRIDHIQERIDFINKKVAELQS